MGNFGFIGIVNVDCAKWDYFEQTYNRFNIRDMKKYSGLDYDSIMVYLDEHKTPIVFERKIKELMEQGAFDNEDDARKWLRTTPIELELYYHTYCGLFGVESDAVECCDIYDPYDGQLMEECDD